MPVVAEGRHFSSGAPICSAAGWVDLGGGQREV